MRATPTAEEVAQGRVRLADGRRAAAASDYATALAAFDDALAVTPTDPRLLCEAGFVAHQAGQTALASARIDAALSAFGPPGATGGDVEHLAQCLYNRGLVDEASGDFVSAIDHYRTSLTLRTNETVRARLTRALARTPATSSGDTMGGVHVDVDARSMLVHVADRDALENALRVGFAGSASIDDVGSDLALDVTSVRVLGEHGGLIVYDVRTQDSQYDVDTLVVAHPEAGAFRIVIGTSSFANTDHGDEDRFLDVALSDLGAYLRIDRRAHAFDNVESMDDASAPGITCYGNESVDYLYTTTLLCRAAPSLACVAPGGLYSRQGAQDSTFEITYCTDADDNDVPPPPAPTTHVPGYALSVSAGADDRITVALVSGTLAEAWQGLIGTHTFDDLADQELTHVEPATGHTDRERAALDE